MNQKNKMPGNTAMSQDNNPQVDATAGLPLSDGRRNFLHNSALLLGASMLAQPHLAGAQTYARAPANATELDAKYFPGFETMTLDTNGVSIHTLVGGSGPPLLLLHGAPQSHFTWAVSTSVSFVRILSV